MNQHYAGLEFQENLKNVIYGFKRKAEPILPNNIIFGPI